MLAQVRSYALFGLDAVPVTVEVDVSPGLPSYALVGLPDKAVEESRERVRAALKNAGFPYPQARVVVNLAPAELRKEGSQFDLPIALGLLAAQGVVPLEALSPFALAGELGLDGSLRPVPGAVNLALAGMAVLTGVALLAGLRWLTSGLGDGVAIVVNALPVFPLAIVGSLLVRLALERSGQAHWASAPVQSQIGTLSADLLITAATAGLDLGLLRADWLPLTVLAVSGLAWNLGVTLLLAPRVLPADWFERAVIEFGQATGVAASGLLLLRMADPDDRSDALPAFSIKQLLLQPFLAGGVITVVAPLAVASWGLPLWTAACLAVVVLAGGAGLLLARLQAPAP